MTALNISHSEGTLQPMSGRRKRNTYPEPLIIPSIAQQHTHSIILLHGRGSNAERFGSEFLQSKTSSGLTIPETFPGLNIIFPTAGKRRSTILKRVPINQWFDNYSLSDPSERQDLQYDGISETSNFLHEIIKKEADLVGVNNLVLGGLSQGCAMGLQVPLNFDADSLDKYRVTGENGFLSLVWRASWA